MAQKRGAEIVRSLLIEGYIRTSQSEGLRIMVLRHRYNGNVITVICAANGVTLYKNGAFLKFEAV